MRVLSYRVGRYIFSLLQAHTTGIMGTALVLLRGGGITSVVATGPFIRVMLVDK